VTVTGVEQTRGRSSLWGTSSHRLRKRKEHAENPLNISFITKVVFAQVKTFKYVLVLILLTEGENLLQCADQPKGIFMPDFSF
jgi:hypothetical protein